MALSAEDVQRIARLAKIAITPVEAAAVREKLDRVLEFIGRLRAVDTIGVVPMAHAQEMTLPLRIDAVTETDQRELYQSIAPAVAEGLYLVPKVIE